MRLIEELNGESKEFPTLIVASAITGIALTKTSVSEMHQCIEHLCGCPVWTHELIDPQIKEYALNVAMAQFPLLPSRDEAKHDFEAAAKKAVDSYGETITVQSGNFKRTDGPVETLSRILSKPCPQATHEVTERETTQK